jgi:anaerobic selenocysteine-containing dehydrogenase
VIDPIRTRTADAADSHLALIPGTDAALALGLLDVVLPEGTEDKDFISRHTYGWETFRTRILEYPPDRVADICGVPAHAIVDLGTRIAHTRPTAIRLTMGLQRHGDSKLGTRLASSTIAARSSHSSRSATASAEVWWPAPRADGLVS